MSISTTEITIYESLNSNRDRKILKWFRKTPQLCITSFGTTYLYSEKTLINEYDWTKCICFDLRTLYLNSRKIFTWGILFNQNYCEAIVPNDEWIKVILFCGTKDKTRDKMIIWREREMGGGNRCVLMPIIWMTVNKFWMRY